MYTLCWSAKGGSGTTVVAAALAIVSARRAPTVLVDLGGDSASALGVAEPAGPGVGDWLSMGAAGADRLWQLAEPCGTDLQILHQGAMPSGAEFTEFAAERLAAAAADSPHHVIIDAGAIVPTDAMLQCAQRSLLVIRPCYLALRRAAAFGDTTSDLIVVAEPGRCLSRVDIERALGAHVVAELPWDPGVARSVDAGLLQSRLPLSLSRPLDRLLRAPSRSVPQP
jgi:cellulose biosynthesis protein BcsQ